MLNFPGFNELYWSWPLLLYQIIEYQINASLCIEKNVRIYFSEITWKIHGISVKHEVYKFSRRFSDSIYRALLDYANLIAFFYNFIKLLHAKCSCTIFKNFPFHLTVLET